MRKRGTARLFVAIDPPAGACERLTAWAREATIASGLRVSGGAVRLLDAGSLHLTLCFLGERPTQEIDAIDAALQAGAVGVGELSIGAPLWLPRKRPRALAVEVHDGAGELRGLHDALARAIAQATAWEPDHRRFRGHVTLARLRGRGRGARTLAAPGGLPATPSLRFTPQMVTLYRSTLAPGGSLYEPLARSRLLPAEL
ncbi:MAG TPA: RNA 2',3'-cyclic phosphodiesterase [Solirubrobacteraceae bacterium]|nr:RNA 2',3'-cyclic phosphodiesterase [Solirubrobacteraceae bacterium]